MKIRVKDLGEHRWLCYCWPANSLERHEFIQWCQSHPGNFWISRNTHVWGTEPIEVRGGSRSDQLLLAMRWAGGRHGPENST